jgi:DNA-binding response OmpR family regulator
MPGMDGFKVMEGLKQIDGSAPLPVLVLTSQPGHWIRALGDGAMDFLSKPYRIPELLGHVRYLLESLLVAKGPGRTITAVH